MPVDITGYQARMQIRKTVSSPDVIYEASSATGEIVLNTSEHTITITLLSNITSEFDFTSAVYSMELFNGTNVIPFITGNMTLVPEVTR